MYMHHDIHVHTQAMILHVHVTARVGMYLYVPCTDMSESVVQTYTYEVIVPVFLHV